MMDTTEKLSASFVLAEFLDSQTGARMGIDNTPDALAIAGIRNFLAPGMQKVRDLLGHPVVISSGYRCPALNRAVGGARNSDHMRGLAADFTCPGFGRPLDVAKAIVASGIQFDQLIQEGGQWVHVSFSANPRKQVLTAKFSNGGVTYVGGLS
jgi:zinc D-Ala-D-Ala carboxypeptidase